MDTYRHPQSNSPFSCSCSLDRRPQGLGDAAVGQHRLACDLVPEASGAIPCLMADDDEERVLRQATQLAVQQRQYHQAEALLNCLIDRYPEAAKHFSNRGLIRFWQGHYAQAIDDCDRAIAIDPSLDQAYNNRANCYAALAHQPEAVQDYRRAIDLNPFNVRARINLGLTLREMGDYDGALTVFDEALLFYQLKPRILAERGRTYHLRGDWNCATADYRRALAALAQPSPSRPQPDTLLKDQVQRWLSSLTSVN